MELGEKLIAYSKVSPEGCWEWQRSRSRTGYGQCNVGGGKWELAHRVAYKVYVGEIPDGLLVRHKCDNPCCCNPDHLVLGTQKDNMRDCLERGRFSLGERHATKLTEADVRDILTSNDTNRKLADKYGVCNQLISDIRRGKKWQHVTQQEESNV